MKRLLIFLLMAGGQIASAQDFEGKARDITDSLVAVFAIPSSNRLPTAVDYSEIYDSVLMSIVSQAVQHNISSGHFSFPQWYLMAYNNKGRIPDFTKTGYQWLKYQYQIEQDGPSNGCLWQQAFEIFDSLMIDAVESKYGEGLFRRAAWEADSLDKSGMGLRLPYVGLPDSTLKMLNDSFAFVKTLPFDGSDSSRYLRFEFKNACIASVFICKWLYYIQQDFAYMGEYPKLTNIARNLDWITPSFLGKPVDAVVFWDLRAGDMFFE